MRSEGGIDWRFISISLGSLVALGIAFFLLFGDKVLSVPNSNPVRDGVETADTTGSGASNVSYVAPTTPVDVAGFATVQSSDGVIIEPAPPVDGAPTEYAKETLSVDKNFTGAAFTLAGRQSAILYYQDTIMVQVHQAPIDSFFVNGVKISESTGIDMPTYLLRQLRTAAGDRADALVSFGTVTGKDKQVGAYVITDGGNNGSRYLEMYLWNGSTVMYVNGPIGSSQVIPAWLLTLSLN